MAKKERTTTYRNHIYTVHGTTKSPCRHGKQEWDGSPPTCAFRSDGKFNRGNWNCRLMSKLRALGDSTSWDGSRPEYSPRSPGVRIWDDDNNISVIPLKSAFAILSFYKDRGRTSGFWMIDDSAIREGTEKDANLVVKNHNAWFRQVRNTERKHWSSDDSRGKKSVGSCTHQEQK